MENQSMVLNPDYRLKNDIDRIIMYSNKQIHEYSSPNWIGFIHPVQAMLLSIFSIENLTSGYYREILNNLKMSLETAEKLVKPFFENETPIYTEFKGQKVMFPKNVLIGKDKIPNPTQIIKQSCDFNCTTIDLTPDRMHRAPQSLLFMLTNKCVTNCNKLVF